MTPEDLENLDPELAALLDAQRGYSDMPTGAPARLFSKVSTTLGLLPPGGGGPGHAGTARSPSLPTTGTAPGVWSVAKGALVATFGAGALVGALGHAAFEHATRPTRSSVLDVPAEPTATGSAAAASSTPATPSEPSAAIAPTALLPTITPPPAAARSGSTSQPEGDDQALAAERAQLEVARTALARGQVDTALGLLEHQAVRFPHGRLAEERDSLWIQALVAAGRGTTAQQRAAQFKQRYPRSLFLPVIDAALGQSPSTPR